MGKNLRCAFPLPLTLYPSFPPYTFPGIGFLPRRRQFLLAFHRLFISSAWHVTNPDCFLKLLGCFSSILEKGVNSSHRFMSAGDKRAIGFRRSRFQREPIISQCSIESIRLHHFVGSVGCGKARRLSERKEYSR